jgi:hypothetical protein
VVIEKEEGDGTYSELRRESTPELSIELSLSPGKYRCQVIPHNILNQPGEASQWMYIEVLAVPNPETVNTLEPVHKTGTQVVLFFGAAWMPSFTVSDRGNRFFREDVSPAGVAGRFGVAVTKWKYFNPGAELAVSYNAFGTGAEAGHLLAFTLNLSALKRLPGDKTALTFRLGAGYSLLLPESAAEAGGLANGSSRGSPPADGAAHATVGVSFLLFVMKSWYLETGLDYAQMLPAPSSGCFRPWLGIGFSR